jgi:hypothetical protein
MPPAISAGLWGCNKLTFGQCALVGQTYPIKTRRGMLDDARIDWLKS